MRPLLLAALLALLPWGVAAPGPVETPVQVEELGVTVGLPAGLLILAGCFFILAAAIGVLRFPDFYTRLHASTKLVTLGGIGIFGGAGLALGSAGAIERVLLIAAFFFLTAPISAYMIARSGYLRGLPPFMEEGVSRDEWGALGEAVEELEEA